MAAQPARTEWIDNPGDVSESTGAPFLPPKFPVVPGLEVAVHARVGRNQVLAGGESLDVVEVGGSFAVETPGTSESEQAGATSHVVGGDFANVFPMGDAYAIVYGDVSSKGPEAESLALMASCRLEAIAGPGVAPCSVLTDLNRELYSAGHKGDLLALVYAAYEPGLGRLRLSNCGCWPPVLVSRGRTRILDSGGVLLGATEDLECEDIELTLRPGDMLVGCTDGISESRRATGFFGEEAFTRLLADHFESPAPIVASAIVTAAEKFGPLSDDATVLVLRATA